MAGEESDPDMLTPHWLKMGLTLTCFPPVWSGLGRPRQAPTLDGLGRGRTLQGPSHMFGNAEDPDLLQNEADNEMLSHEWLRRGRL